MAYPTCLIDFALRGIKSTNSLSTNQEQQWQSKTQPVNRTTNPSQFFMHILIGILIGTPKLSLDQFLILFKLIKTTYLRSYSILLSLKSIKSLYSIQNFSFEPSKIRFGGISSCVGISSYHSPSA
ncbi:hypothetical protein H4Q26_016226 [Puccinia striiformis f. sp. tritici PST-130]|nr:hypothetical protein H4Q26_016226 [Puccinia striiformis f. sp. tritici PST-130]